MSVMPLRVLDVLAVASFCVMFSTVGHSAIGGRATRHSRNACIGAGKVGQRHAATSRACFVILSEYSEACTWAVKWMVSQECVSASVSRKETDRGDRCSHDDHAMSWKMANTSQGSIPGMRFLSCLNVSTRRWHWSRVSSFPRMLIFRPVSRLDTSRRRYSITLVDLFGANSCIIPYAS